MITIKKYACSLLLIIICTVSSSVEQTKSFSLQKWMKQKAITTFQAIKNNSKKTALYFTCAVSTAVLLSTGGIFLKKYFSKSNTKKQKDAGRKTNSVQISSSIRPDLDEFGYTAFARELMELYPDTKKIEQMLKDNPQINIHDVDFMGNSALGWLARHSTNDILKRAEWFSFAQELVNKYHADVEKTNRSGITPLMMACRLGNTHMAQKLIEDLGANVNTQTSRTALIEAVNHDKIETANYLLSKGADPNLPNQHGVHPIMFATSKKMAELLVNFKADIRTATAGPEYNHQTPTQAFARLFIKEQDKPYERHAELRDYLAPFS